MLDDRPKIGDRVETDDGRTGILIDLEEDGDMHMGMMFNNDQYHVELPNGRIVVVPSAMKI